MFDSVQIYAFIEACSNNDALRFWQLSTLFRNRGMDNQTGMSKAITIIWGNQSSLRGRF